MWECGLIDLKVNEIRNLPIVRVCRDIISEWPDLLSETNELEELGAKLGVIIVFTPKAHCEHAGRGIEYCWGFAKLAFRRGVKTTTKNLKSKVPSMHYILP